MKKGFLYLLLASCLLCSCDNKKLDNYDDEAGEYQVEKYYFLSKK